MKQQKKKHNYIKNKSAIFIGGGTALFCILFLPGIFQAFISLIFGVNNFHLGFDYIIFKPIFSSQNNATAIAYYMIYLSPFVFNIILLEIGTALLKKTSIGNRRFSLIIFTLVIAGYLIINVFYGAIVSQLAVNSANNWNQLIVHLKIINPGKIIFMFVIILMLISYLRSAAKRILEYIN